MATFCVCLKCGSVQETVGIDQIPEGWQQSRTDLLCPRCAGANVLDGAAASDVIDEEVIYPPSDVTDDTLDENFCEVCSGHCQGH